MILKIAFRNILRHKRRTFLSAITIAFGLMLFILFDSLLSGIDRSSMENMVNLTDGSLKIYSKEYAAEKMAYPLKYGINNINSLTDYAKTLPEVTGVTSRISFLTEIINGDRSLRTVGSVIQPDTDPKVFTLSKYIVAGRFFSRDNTQEVILGKKLAGDLGVGVGDTVLLNTRTRFEANNAVDFEVVGLLETPAPFINESGIFITFQAANQFLDVRDFVTEFVIHVPWGKMEDINAYVGRINRLGEKITLQFPELNVNTFYDINSAFIEMMAGKRKGQSMITFFILLIGAVGIVNTVLMSVYERIREVGVLRALGIQPNEIRRMFLYEGILVGLVGGLMGILAGFLVNIWFVNSGMDLSAMMKNVDSSQMPISGVFYGQWNIRTFFIAILLGMIISALAAVVPARKAAKITPTQCLKFN
jgi:ABC-type lipoprotein release transport system permease subunit